METKASRAELLIPAGLIGLALVPTIAGTYRLAMLAGAVPPEPDAERFFAAPLPVVLHILSATLYAFLGAFQFSPGLRRRKPGWHRAAGRVLVVAGLIAALSGLWMAQFYAIVPADHPLLYAFRMAAGVAMTIALVLGFLAIRRRDISNHQDWMRRAYAIAMGAGTQVVVLMPVMVVWGQPDALSLALLMGLGWAINIAIAEWLILRRRGVGLARTA